MEKLNYFNRDLSWLSFNERVLLEAANEDVPLFERIKFLAIYSSNLDEFFRVRVAIIKRLNLLDKGKINKRTESENPKKLLTDIYRVVDVQQKKFGAILTDSILPDLIKNKIHLYYNEPYRAYHLQAVEEIFYASILAFIQPIILRPEDTRPLFLENKKLYIISELIKNGQPYLGILNIPVDEVSRFKALPRGEGCYHFTFIDDILKYYSKIIFAGFEVKANHSVKLNRDAELFLDDEYSNDIAHKIRKSLEKRHVGMPARFLYNPEMPSATLNLLKAKMDLLEDDCIRGGNYHNLSDLFTLPNPGGKKLENILLPPLTHVDVANQVSIFAAIQKRDILLSFPFQKYDYILRFFNEAAIDPDVSSIKATLYRVAKDSHITNALISAARNGKKVSVLIEAKARFDEENNLKWAEQMKKAGVRIFFSEESLKVHAKVALIKRRQGAQTVKYAFLGTGNFNERTADVYTDFALLTTDVRLTNELDKVLRFTLEKKKIASLEHLLVAQINMPEVFTRLIDAEIASAGRGKAASIILKLNNLQDREMINKLYEAANAGVQVQLIIRGICCLVPRKNIRVIRIVDRFLEHSRIYLFGHGATKKLFLGSADWMERNLYRRIEVVFPVYDKNAQRLILHCLKLQLADNAKSVNLNERLENVPVAVVGRRVRSQYDYYQYLKRIAG